METEVEHKIEISIEPISVGAVIGIRLVGVERETAISILRRAATTMEDNPDKEVIVDQVDHSSKGEKRILDVLQFTTKGIENGNND